jgi:hypothetical protein
MDKDWNAPLFVMYPAVPWPAWEEALRKRFPTW